MLFARKRNLEDFVVKIERKTEARFLGDKVDKKLNWSEHIETHKSKISKHIGVIY